MEVGASVGNQVDCTCGEEQLILALKGWLFRKIALPQAVVAEFGHLCLGRCSHNTPEHVNVQDMDSGT